MSSPAVLLMAYGGPDSLDDLEPYLRQVRGGRPATPALLAEMRERYARIGGRSPLLGTTRAQAAALQAELARRGRPARVYVGMRHWTPTIAQAVQHIAADGCGAITALCMTPQASRLSTGAYREQLLAGYAQMADSLRGAPLRFIESWHDHPGFITTAAAFVREALDRFPPDQLPTVLFTAHSLPAAALGPDDPYDSQTRETAARVASAAGLPPARWRFAYQCAPRGAAGWLGPQLCQALPALAAEQPGGGVLVAPVGFVADHVETLYDLDIELRAEAAALGLRLERAAVMNTHPAFIAALADLALDPTRQQLLRP